MSNGAKYLKPSEHLENADLRNKQKSCRFLWSKFWGAADYYMHSNRQEKYFSGKDVIINLQFSLQ